MFRNILHSRRVNKARRRLMALLPPDRVTVPTFALRLSERHLATCINGALDLWSEDDLMRLYVETKEVEGIIEPSIDNKLTSSQSSPSQTVTTSLTGRSLKASSLTTHNTAGDVSLSHLIYILVKTLNPDSVFALDSVLRSSILSGTSDRQSDCVFLTEVCICTNHIRAVRVVLDKALPVLLPDSQTDEVSIPMFTYRPISDQSSFRKYVETKLIESPATDLDTKENHSVLMFDPLLAVCKAWRWPDLSSGEWIR
ncbi:hypothetical protein D915_001942 [Fasciola hepatica]|uniref:Uncharacterized protein n=1 Tax=Fasciola hepatica TaxID=6192 RepID=A0A4E0RYB8_FASHE|nr:hypothetical protein D915_001942 [Fasciola hepatica]